MSTPPPTHKSVSLRVRSRHLYYVQSILEAIGAQDVKVTGHAAGWVHLRCTVPERAIDELPHEPDEQDAT
jgi:hypothetical protein